MATSAPGQLCFPFAHNQGLFSQNYLDTRLRLLPQWSEWEPRARTAFDEVRRVHERAKGANLGLGEESQLEEQFIRPVLQALGFNFDVQPKSTHRGGHKRPDYALFLSNDDYLEARKHKLDLPKYFGRAVAILEAKAWGRRLNDADARYKMDPSDPTAQTVRYLDDAYHHSDKRVKWAILTNGQLWRLFYYHTHYPAGTFFQVDLDSLLAQGDFDSFKQFYMFFSRDAFTLGAKPNQTLLDVHINGSQEYATEISGHLKELIFDRVFVNLAQGFIEFRQNELSITAEDPASLRDVYNGCLTLLYRLLFLLHAESRDLLPLNDDRYHKVSITKLRSDVAEELASTPRDKVSRVAANYWERFITLCNTVARGDKSCNVPVYNGGLFEDKDDVFLSRHKLADYYFAPALYDLTASDELGSQGRPAFYDYSSLQVRHLGDIYEGLLEFSVRVAATRMCAVMEKGREVWLTESEARGKLARRTCEPGQVYIENSRHERKATGSYFTPHYIVEFIVANAVGPILDARVKAARAILERLAKLYRKQRAELRVPKDWHHWEHVGKPKGRHADELLALEQELSDTLFDLKVLDPAMGSGHFLVHAVDFISRRLVNFLSEYPDNLILARIRLMRAQIEHDVVERQGVKLDTSKLAEVNLIKRMVMKRCVYGVDLNRMAVELAKLSLWLNSFTLGAPLSFLDSHLKHGNSLVGQDDVKRVILGGGRRAQFRSALRFAAEIARLPDSTLAEVEQSRRDAAGMKELLAPFKRRLDFILARDAGLAKVKSLATQSIEDAIQSDSVAELAAASRADVEAADRVASSMGFFHWHVEFPEVFYDQSGEAERGGFDAVIGNPPYDVLSAREQNRDEEEVAREKGYYSQVPDLQVALGDKLNYYRLFVARAVALVRTGGRHSFIVPMGILGDDYARRLREHLLSKCHIAIIEAFPQKDDPERRVFREAKLPTTVYVLTKPERYSPNVTFTLRVHPFKEIDPTTPTVTLSAADVRRFSPHQLSLPAKPRCTDAEVRLAVQLGRGTVVPLAEYAASKQGEVNVTTHKSMVRWHEHRPSVCPDGMREVLRGAYIDRYELQEPKQGGFYYVDSRRFAGAGPRADTKAGDHRYERVGYQRGAAIDNWRRIIATLIPVGAFCADTVNYVVQPKVVSLRFVLGVLNSALLEWRFRLTSTTNHVNSYEVDSLPFPRVDLSEATNRAQHDRVVELVETMLKLHEDAAKAKTQSRRDSIQRQIDATDKKIDVLVYKLYRLTEDEIAIVEGRTK
jgi:hypothetical protein